MNDIYNDSLTVNEKLELLIATMEKYDAEIAELKEKDSTGKFMVDYIHLDNMSK